jgi:hypothetical protein
LGDDIANAVFPRVAGASYITGQNVLSDGGVTMSMIATFLAESVDSVGARRLTAHFRTVAVERHQCFRDTAVDVITCP